MRYLNNELLGGANGLAPPMLGGAGVEEQTSLRGGTGLRSYPAVVEDPQTSAGKHSSSMSANKGRKSASSPAAESGGKNYKSGKGMIYRSFSTERWCTLFLLYEEVGYVAPVNSMKTVEDQLFLYQGSTKGLVRIPSAGDHHGGRATSSARSLSKGGLGLGNSTGDATEDSSDFVAVSLSQLFRSITPREVLVACQERLAAEKSGCLRPERDAGVPCSKGAGAPTYDHERRIIPRDGSYLPLSDPGGGQYQTDVQNHAFPDEVHPAARRLSAFVETVARRDALLPSRGCGGTTSAAPVPADGQENSSSLGQPHHGEQQNVLSQSDRNATALQILDVLNLIDSHRRDPARDESQTRAYDDLFSDSSLRGAGPRFVTNLDPAPGVVQGGVVGEQSPYNFNGTGSRFQVARDAERQQRQRDAEIEYRRRSDNHFGYVAYQDLKDPAAPPQLAQNLGAVSTLLGGKEVNDNQQERSRFFAPQRQSSAFMEETSGVQGTTKGGVATGGREREDHPTKGGVARRSCFNTIKGGGELHDVHQGENLLPPGGGVVRKDRSWGGRPGASRKFLFHD